ncbi:MAG TPA: hypothetical protein VE825_17335 [Terriglobales bacterium]|jgi:hypothetical protein|nr:hypothetical protein [Terriglobales bacterium]
MKLEKRVQIVLPVKVSPWTEGQRPVFQMVCTFDLSQKGARLGGVRGVKEAGQILVLERSGSRAFYRVMWVGKAGTPQGEQIGVQCIEPDKWIWDINLAELEEQYEPISTGLQGQAGMGPAGPVKPQGFRAHIVPDGTSVDPVEGELAELSANRCHVQAAAKMPLQIAVQVLLVGADFDLRMKGTVQRCEPEKGVTLNLIEVRRGDRRRLNFLLSQL